MSYTHEATPLIAQIGCARALYMVARVTLYAVLYTGVRAVRQSGRHGSVNRRNTRCRRNLGSKSSLQSCRGHNLENRAHNLEKKALNLDFRIVTSTANPTNHWVSVLLSRLSRLFLYFRIRVRVHVHIGRTYICAYTKSRRITSVNLITSTMASGLLYACVPNSIASVCPHDRDNSVTTNPLPGGDCSRHTPTDAPTCHLPKWHPACLRSASAWVLPRKTTRFRAGGTATKLDRVCFVSPCVF